MKLTDNISLQELLPKDTFMKYGTSGVKLIDKRLPVILERIRELCGGKPMTLNDWFYGGRFNLRGYRPPECAIGATKSMHKQGMAADFTVKGMTAEQVRNVIRGNATELMQMGLTRMEKDVSWVHIDLKVTGLSTIYEFKP